MAKIIQHKDIIRQGNPFDDAIAGAKRLLEMEDKLIAKGKQIMASLPKSVRTSGDISKITKAQKAVTQIEKERATIRRQLNSVIQKATIVEGIQNKALQKKKISLQESNRVMRDSIKLQKAQKGSIEALRLTVRKEIKERDKLGKITGKNKIQFDKLTQSINTQNKALLKHDKAIGRSQRNVGNYAQGVKRAALSLAGALGLTAGVAGLLRMFRGGIRVFTEFSAKMSKVAAISGATGKDLRNLTNDAKKLGETTQKTASEVAQLQIEYAKLGFSVGEIRAATKATLELSIATGEDLAQSAIVAASTVRGFGFQAKDTQKVVDIMADSFSSSALDLNKFQIAMAKVAPVANNAGVSIERTTAQLSILVNRGLEASIAGTSLRNVFLELSKQGITFEEAMLKINSSVDKNKTALDLFGKRGAVTGTILAQTGEEVDNLTKQYENSAGAAARMAKVMQDNLKNDAIKAKSALQGLAIVIGERLDPSLRNATQGLTRFISRITEYFKVPLSDKIIEEQIEFNRLFSEIVKTTEATNERRIAVENLQRIYPDYIANVDLNTASEESLRKELKLTNVEYQNRYLLLLANEKVDKASRNVVRKTITLSERDAALKKRFLSMARDQGKLDEISGKNLTQQKNILGFTGQAWTFYQAAIADVTFAQGNLNKVQKETDEIIEFATKHLTGNIEAQEESTNEIRIAERELQKLMDARAKGVAIDKEEITAAQKKLQLLRAEKAEKESLLIVDPTADPTKKATGFALLTKTIAENEKELRDLQLLQLKGIAIDEKKFKALVRENDILKQQKILVDILTKSLEGLTIADLNEFDATKLLADGAIDLTKELDKVNKKIEEIRARAGNVTLGGEGQGFLMQLLGLEDEEDIDLVKERLNSLLGEIVSFFTRLADLKLQVADENQQIAQNELDRLEDDLKHQELLQAQGAASNIDILKDQITEQERLRDRANVEYARAQKNRQRIDDAQQISSILTAIANIIESWSETGTLGFILGILAAGVMLTSFIAMKADVKNLKEGEIMIQGHGTETSDSIPANLSVNESVINARSSKRTPKILTAINDGLLTDADLIPALDMYSLNFGLNRPNTIIHNDYSALVRKMDKQILTTERTNKLLGKWKFISPDGKTIMDVDGNKVTHV